MRYKLVPATIRSESGIRRGAAWYVDGRLDDAIVSATAAHADNHVPVLICEAPPDGIIRHIQTIGGTKRTRRQAR